MKHISSLVHIISALFAPIFPSSITKTTVIHALLLVWITTILIALPRSQQTIQNYITPTFKKISLLPDALPVIWPQDLTIEINQGQVTTNVDEPYFIPITNISTLLKAIDVPIGGIPPIGPDYLLIVDTSAVPSDITNYQTVALLTQNAITVLGSPQSGDEYYTTILEPQQTVTINQAFIAEFAQNFSNPINILHQVVTSITVMLVASYYLGLAASVAVLVTAASAVTASLLKIDISTEQNITSALFLTITTQLASQLNLLIFENPIDLRLQLVITTLANLITLIRLQERVHLKPSKNSSYSKTFTPPEH